MKGRRIISTFILIFCWTTMSMAQQDTSHITVPTNSNSTLSGDISSHISAFGPQYAYGLVLQGGFVLNKKYRLGGFYSVIKTVPSSVVSLTPGTQTSFEQFGVYGEYIFFPEKFLHPVLSLKVSVGGLNVSNVAGYDYNNLTGTYGDLNDRYWACTPQLNLEARVTSWLNAYIGLGYRQTFGVNDIFYSDRTVSSPEGSLGLVFTAQ